MTAPTESEIRTALRQRVEAYPADNPKDTLREAVRSWAATLISPAFDTLESIDPRDGPTSSEPDDLWRDLRPSEAVTLRDLARAAIERAIERCDAVILDELTAAGVRFAMEHPDAPRAAAREKVPA